MGYLFHKPAGGPSVQARRPCAGPDSQPQRGKVKFLLEAWHGDPERGAEVSGIKWECWEIFVAERVTVQVYAHTHIYTHTHTLND